MLVYAMRIDVFSATSASQRSRVIVSHEKNTQSSEKDSEIASKFKNALPFEPLTFTFQDIQYFIETPQVKRLKSMQDQCKFS